MKQTNMCEVVDRKTGMSTFYKVFPLEEQKKGAVITWDKNRRTKVGGVEVVPSDKFYWDNGYLTPKRDSTHLCNLKPYMKEGVLQFIIAEPIRQIEVTYDWVTDRIQYLVQREENMTVFNPNVYLMIKVSKSMGMKQKEFVLNGKEYIAIETNNVVEQTMPQLMEQASKGLL